MSYQYYAPWSHSDTPKSITVLIFITVLASICCALLEPLFINIFKMQGPLEFFGLSWWGLSHYYIWQPLTSLFLQNDSSGINITFLISLAFNMYMLWLFGSNLVEAHGTASFLCLYLLSGILASLAALLATSKLLPFNIIAGATPSLLATFVAWAILHRDTQILLFFLIPVKAKWLLAAVIVLALLIPLSELDRVRFVYYLVGIMTGYLYSTLVWHVQTPFTFMEKVDNFFINLGRKISPKIQRLFSSKKEEAKIVDIKTGQAVLDDDAFIDAMLAKISRYGEKSLTWQERERMQKISEKKMKRNPYN